MKCMITLAAFVSLSMVGSAFAADTVEHSTSHSPLTKTTQETTLRKHKRSHMHRKHKMTSEDQTKIEKKTADDGTKVDVKTEENHTEKLNN